MVALMDQFGKQEKLVQVKCLQAWIGTKEVLHDSAFKLVVKP